MNIIKKVRSSYGLKIGLALSFSLIFLTGFSILFFYTQSSALVMGLMGKRLEDIAKTGTYVFTAEDRQAMKRLKSIVYAQNVQYDKLIASLNDSENTKESLPPEVAEKIMASNDFQSMVQRLRSIKYASKSNVSPLKKYTMSEVNSEKDTPLAYFVYLYIDVPTENKDVKIFLADADYNDPEVRSYIGNLYKVPASQKNTIFKAFTGKAAVSNEFASDTWGTFLTGAAPIFDEDGKVIAILGIDFDITNEQNKLSLLLKIAIFAIIFMIAISIIGTLIITRRFSKPIEELRSGAEKVRQRDFSSQIEMERSDELGMLAETFNMMSNEVKEYISEVEELNASYFRFVPKEFLDNLGVNSMREIQLGNPVQKNMTILFSDIRSFTSISEDLSPVENFNFLNSYLHSVSPVIRDNNGFIDKYIGDAIMALFSMTPDDAVNAAIEMRRTLREYNSTQSEKGHSAINIGIGIHTGSLMLGTIGEEQRMQTTVISDSVNLASRLEGLTKKLYSPVLISDDTLAAISDPNLYELRFMGNVRVKGKKKPVKVFQILSGEKEETIQIRLQTKELFEQGLAYFFEGKMNNAVECLTQVLEQDPTDFAAKMYLERAQGII